MLSFDTTIGLLWASWQGVMHHDGRFELPCGVPCSPPHDRCFFIMKDEATGQSLMEPCGRRCLPPPDPGADSSRTRITTTCQCAWILTYASPHPMRCLFFPFSFPKCRSCILKIYPLSIDAGEYCHGRRLKVNDMLVINVTAFIQLKNVAIEVCTYW